MVSWICRIIGHKRYAHDMGDLIHAGGLCLRCDAPPLPSATKRAIR